MERSNCMPNSKAQPALKRFRVRSLTEDAAHEGHRNGLPAQGTDALANPFGLPSRWPLQHPGIPGDSTLPPPAAPAEDYPPGQEGLPGPGTGHRCKPKHPRRPACRKRVRRCVKRTGTVPRRTGSAAGKGSPACRKKPVRRTKPISGNRCTCRKRGSR